MRSLSRSPLWAFVLVLTVGTTAYAQTFTGGLRGAVRDANGVIPGVTVQLINEATGQARDAVSNDQGEYNFAAVPPGTYTIKASLTGFKSYENKGVRIGTQQFVTLDIRLEVGQLQETITVTGEAPLIDTSNASTGAIIDSRQLETLPSGRPFGVSVRGDRADGGCLGRRAVQPPAGSDQRVAAVARRRHAPRQQLPGGRRADHRHAQPRVRQPDDRGDRRRQRPGASVRRRNRPHRRRHLQRRHQVGQQRAGTAAASIRRGRAGARRTTSSPSAPACRCRRPISTRAAAASAARSSGTARSSGSPTRATARTRRATARCACRPRASVAATSRRPVDSAGRLVVIYDPLTGDPATGTRPHGRSRATSFRPNRLNQVARDDDAYLPPPIADVSDGAINFNRTARDQRPRADVHRQGGSPHHRPVSLNGFYLYNKTNEPCANYFEPGLDGPNRFVDSRDYILRAASTCSPSTTPGCRATTRC